MNPGTTPTTELHRQTSTLTGQLSESTDSVFLYYKLHFFLSILDGNQSDTSERTEQSRSLGTSQTASWLQGHQQLPPQQMSSGNAQDQVYKELGQAGQKNRSPLVTHEKDF